MLKGSDCITQGERAGKAFKIILERLQNPIPHEISKEAQEKMECSHDCLKCKNYTRREAYNQQWGMVQFYNNSCDKGHTGKINSYYDGIECADFERGENTLVYMSDKEKKELGVYIPHRED